MESEEVYNISLEVWEKKSSAHKYHTFQNSRLGSGFKHKILLHLQRET